MMNKEKCSCCSAGDNNKAEVIIGQYVCYCNHVTEDDIKDAVIQGAKTVQEVIKKNMSNER